MKRVDTGSAGSCRDPCRDRRPSLKVARFTVYRAIQRWHTLALTPPTDVQKHRHLRKSSQLSGSELFAAKTVLFATSSNVTQLTAGSYCQTGTAAHRKSMEALSVINAVWLDHLPMPPELRHTTWPPLAWFSDYVVIHARWMTIRALKNWREGATATLIYLGGVAVGTPKEPGCLYSRARR